MPCATTLGKQRRLPHSRHVPDAILPLPKQLIVGPTQQPNILRRCSSSLGKWLVVMKFQRTGFLAAMTPFIDEGAAIILE